MKHLLALLLLTPLCAGPVVLVGPLPEASPYASEVEPPAKITTDSFWKYRGLGEPVRFRVVSITGGISVRPVGTLQETTRWNEADFRRHFLRVELPR